LVLRGNPDQGPPVSHETQTDPERQFPVIMDGTPTSGEEPR
jgi:hypothetical protein